jgi:polyphosphate kinase 2 (PPK2 family)
MLEQIDLDRRVAKATYERRLPDLQSRLYELELQVRDRGLPVAIVFEGWAAAGKGGAIRTLTGRLDPRGCVVVPITPPRTWETRYPWLHRFWQRTPAYGQIVVFDTSWYRRVLIDRIDKRISKTEWQAAYQDILDFEQTLAADGTVFVKLWLHLGKKEQSKRITALLKDKLTAWQVTDEDRQQHAAYDRYLLAVEEMLARTDTAWAPWVIVEATHKHFARLKILETAIDAIGAALARPAVPAAGV